MTEEIVLTFMIPEIMWNWEMFFTVLGQIFFFGTIALCISGLSLIIAFDDDNPFFVLLGFPALLIMIIFTAITGVQLVSREKYLERVEKAKELDKLYELNNQK